MNLSDLLQHSKIDPLDAEIIAGHALQKPRAWVLARPDYKLTGMQEKKIRALLARRAAGEPLAYLTHHKEFFGLDFLVDRRVLVPRPETELLVGETIKILKAISYKLRALLIDVGTGSGCVAIAVAKNLVAVIPTESRCTSGRMEESLSHQSLRDSSAPLRSAQNDITVIATDISKPALAVAKKNAKKHGVKIRFLHGHLLAPVIKKPNTLYLTPSTSVVVTANLPYGWKEWKNNCSMETRGLKFEPTQALFTDKHGLQLYEKLLQQIKKIFLSNTFHLLLEFDPRQTIALKKLIKKHLPGTSVEIKKDLAGHDRVAIIYFDTGSPPCLPAGRFRGDDT